MNQRIHKPSSGIPTQEKRSQFAPRLFGVQEDFQNPLAQEGAENSWAQKLERTSQLGHNFAAIPVHGPDKQEPEPVIAQRAEGEGVTRQPVSGPPVVQRFIKGKGGVEGVYALLKKNEDWKKFFNSNGKKSGKYKEDLESLLNHLHSDWQTGFEPGDIADAILLNSHDSAGLERAKKTIVESIEDYIDEEVLTGGHSGEKHYGKDAKYQKARMKKEGKQKVTTLEDASRTKKFLTKVRLNVRQDLLSQLGDMIEDIEKEIMPGAVTRQVVKPVTDPYFGYEKIFEESGYSITLETISVNNLPQNAPGVDITIRPKLTSLGDYLKTEYTSDNDESSWAPIVMYWGGNSPSIRILPGDNYGSIYDKLEKAIVGPVTAF